jgi:hypothetical protein
VLVSAVVVTAYMLIYSTNLSKSIAEDNELFLEG